MGSQSKGGSSNGPGAYGTDGFGQIAGMGLNAATQGGFQSGFNTPTGSAAQTGPGQAFGPTGFGNMNDRFGGPQMPLMGRPYMGNGAPVSDLGYDYTPPQQAQGGMPQYAGYRGGYGQPQGVQWNHPGFMQSMRPWQDFSMGALPQYQPDPGFANRQLIGPTAPGAPTAAQAAAQARDQDGPSVSTPAGVGMGAGATPPGTAPSVGATNGSPQSGDAGSVTSSPGASGNGFGGYGGGGDAGYSYSSPGAQPDYIPG